MVVRFSIFFIFFLSWSFTQEAPIFSPESGIHKDLTEINIEVPADIKVFYTLDGSSPNSTSKILQSGNYSLYGNTVFRLLIVNQVDTVEKTKTYIVDKEHKLPVISIITDSTYLFDRRYGLYEKGHGASSKVPYKGANFWKNWERPTFIAYITEENEQVIDQKAGIQMFGGFSMAMPQKSFGLYARSEYGNKRFEYPFFSNRPFKKYKNLVLRNAGGDMRGAHIRDAFAASLIEETGIAVQAYKPVAVYINGKYWGKYNLREKINEHFIKQHFGYDKDSLIIMRHEKEPQYGSTRDYVRFLNKLPYLDINSESGLTYVSKKIDIDNYLLYNACEVYTGNADAGGNIRYYKHMSDTAKWRWIFFDVDHSMNIFESRAHEKNSVAHFTQKNPQDWPHPEWSTVLIRKLLENDSIKTLYIQQFCDLLNTTFKKERAKLILDSLRLQVEHESAYHKERWNIEETIYDLSFSKLYNHIEHRPAILFEHLKDRFNLEKLVTVEVDIPDGVKIRFNNLILDKPFKGNYFSGLPIHMEVLPSFDYDFVGWKSLKSDSRCISFHPGEDIKIVPLVEKRKQSPYAHKVIITEIDAEQDSTYDTDFIELYNTTEQTTDLSGWIISDINNTYQIPENTLLKAKEYLVITENDQIFHKAYEGAALGGLSFGINKKGEVLCLYDIDSCLVDRVDTRQWSKEKKGLNWSRSSHSANNVNYHSWIQELPSPLKSSSFSLDSKRRKEKDQQQAFWIIISGIIFVLIGFSLFLFTLLKR